MAVGDAKTRPTRWQRARADWSGFEWRDLGVGAGGLVLAVIVLASTGSPLSTLAEVGIVGGSALVATLLYPLGQLVWAWLQAPMRMLTEDVIAIRERLEQLEPRQLSAGAEPKKRTNVRLTLLDHVREGREIARDPMLALGGNTSPQITAWTRTAIELVNELVSSEVAEQFLRSTNDTGLQGMQVRIEALQNIADEQNP